MDSVIICYNLIPLPKHLRNIASADLRCWDQGAGPIFLLLPPSEWFSIIGKRWMNACNIPHLCFLHEAWKWGWRPAERESLTVKSACLYSKNTMGGLMITSVKIRCLTPLFLYLITIPLYMAWKSGYWGEMYYTQDPCEWYASWEHGVLFGIALVCNHEWSGTPRVE